MFDLSTLHKSYPQKKGLLPQFHMTFDLPTRFDIATFVRI
ncbi:hypothetical protein ARMA_0479 [Ardenticatena maritima]|uniref:Uncharacterized protein n=1 Tax=Ardenticatena maritima TaxID=872965 RepID=A0A0M8K7S0_9CHLR|nr:hypothetical protein ARMA_0479 [Ardenticatena maritima]